MIYTGRFKDISYYQHAGLIPVSIAGYAPDFYKGIQFKVLAPKYSWWKEWHDKKLSVEWYKSKYQETVLNKLNPKVIAYRLQAFGDHVVLCCYESPEEFCHRQLVADWLRSAGIEVREYDRVLSRALSAKRDLSIDF